MKKLQLVLLMLFASLIILSCTKSGNSAQNAGSSGQDTMVNVESNQPDLQVQYTLSKEYPSKESSIWNQIFTNQEREKEISGLNQNATFWIRVSNITKADSSKWNIYGPLKGSNQLVDISPIEEMETAKKYIQFETQKATTKDLGCCRIRVRIRVVTRKPRITVRNPEPQITISWRKPIPSVTIKGPDIVISDLPKLPSVDSPIPTDGATPNVGMDCYIENENAQLSIQNGESNAVDVWINWKGTITGPIRVDAMTLRKIGDTGYSDCKTATDNIFITQAKFTN